MSKYYPETQVPFSGDQKLLAQWQAGRRFVAALGGAVWTQKPKTPEDVERAASKK